MVRLVSHTEDFDASTQAKPLNPFLEEQFDRLHTNELVKNICRRLDTYVGDEFIEDIMYDTFDMSDTAAENWFKAAYPPSEMSTSSFTILRQPTLDSKCRTVKSKNSPESFLKIVANAYSGIHRQDGMSTKLQCNLISQQPDTDNMIVHSFEFENEIEYWTFVGEIKRTIADFHSGTKHEDAHQTGYCQYLPTSNHNPDPVTPNTDGNGNFTPQPHRKSGGGAPPPSGGFFGGLFSGQKDSGAKTHRWEINGQSLVIIDTHSQYRVAAAVGAITESILGAFDLQELVALTLSVDYAAPAAALLVASLAHAEKSRNKEKECDATGICTSTAYNELVLDVSLKRIINSASDTVDGKDGRKEMEYLPSTIFRRGIGEITVLTLSEQDIVQCELGDGATTTESLASPPGSTATSPLGGSSLSPKMSKSKGIARTSNAPLYFHNLLEVVIHERSDTESVVGTQIVSLGDLTRGENNTEPDFAEVSLEMDPVKNNTHKASSSIFGSFMRRDRDSTPVSASEPDSGMSASPPPTARSPINSKSLIGGTTRPPLPRPTNSATGGGSSSSTVIMKDTRDIRYYEPVFRDVDITLKANSKAARLVIKSASSLPSSSASLEARKVPPTVYATVYLVDSKGEKRSVNSADSRTEAIKSFDPEWNKEVLLQNEHTGVDDITAVMVLLRDSSVGMLKHHHIGRVNIPISCFLDNTQADFCLPLEATYRMNEEDEHFHLGDVHFTTELIDVGPDRKRIKSLARTVSQYPTRTPSSDPGREGASPSGSSGPSAGPTPNNTATTTPGGLSAGIAEPAPARRMTVIGPTPSASGPRSNRNVAAVRYCLYRATAGAVWWPVRLLKTTLVNTANPTPGTTSSTASAEKAGTIAAPRKSSASQLFNQSSNGYGVRSDSVGFIWCGFRAVLIELTPGVTGVLYNCQECEDNVLVVGWHNVVDCLDVSEASMLLTLRINTCTSNATQISRHELFYAPATISLLVGPCQAAALRRECQQRAQFNYIRENIAELSSAVTAFTSTGTSAANLKTRSFNVNRASSPPQSPTATSKPGLPHAPNGANGAAASAPPTLSQVLAANVSTLSMAQSTASAPTISDILSMARAAATALEGIIQHCEALLNKSLLLSLEGNKPISSAARGVLTPTLLQLNPPYYNGFTADVANPKKTVLPLYSPIVKDRQSLVRTIARAKVYFAYLRHVCGRLTALPHDSMDISMSPGSFCLPEFTAEAIQRCVKQDCENVQLFTPLRVGAKIETMVSRFEGFLEAALERLRDYVIFSGGVWEPKKAGLTVEVPTVRAKSRGSGTNQPFFGETGRNEISGKECVQMLLEAYHQTILNYLKPFVGNKEAFRKIAGQDIKNIILKLTIENNSRFEMSAQLAVGCALDMRITPSLPLVEDINTVLEWYSDSLLHDTRSWLIRTLQNANNDRKNRSNLPWDVEMIGDKMVSFLPETLRFQLNVYTEICSVQLTNGSADASHNKAIEVLETSGSIGLGMTMPSGMQVHPTTPVAHALSQAVITERVNEMILHAVSEALVLLAEEYTRALQGRHWDRPDPTTGKLTVHRDFLAAIANDCHRVLTVHLPELQETIRTSTLVQNAKKLGLVEAFGEPADTALRQIMRIVFTDVHSTLIDYDTLWQNPKNLATRTICVAVSSHLRSLQNILCADLFFKLVGSCAQVIVLRLLLFLKLRSNSKHPFSSDDIARLLRDVGQVKQCFQAFMTECDNAGYSLDSDTILPTLQGDVVNHLEDITHGVAAGQFITHSAFESLDILCHLLSEDYDTAEFHRLALGVVEKYDNIPASVNADGSKFKEKDSQQADYNTVPNAVLLGCVAHLRSDAGSELTSFLNAILVSHEHSHSSSQGSSSGSHRAFSPLVDSPALPYDVYVRIFGASFGFSGLNGSGLQEAKHGLKGLLSPGATIKHWREKAADIAVKKGPTMVSAVKTRQNEETAMDLMRMLGLEVQSRSKEERDGAKDTTTAAARRGSGRDWQAQLQAQAAAPPPTGGSYHDPGALSRSLHTDLSGENTPASVADSKADKHKKKKGIFGLRGNKNDDDSSSDSDNDTVSTPQCLIQIGEIQVRALHSSSFIGGPNPYVYFSVNGRKRVKTPVKWDHKEAAWSETFELPADLQTIQEGRITIKVFDKERMRRKRLMGTVTVRLAPLEFHSFESWYALEGGEHGNYGEVHCRLRMINDTSSLNG